MLRGISSLEFEASLSMIGSGGGSSSSVDGGRPGRLPMGGAGPVFMAGTERGPDLVGEGVAEGGTEGGGEGGTEEEGGLACPPLPPLFKSDSSVNVYMPTKLRRMGSPTAMGGTYAEGMNRVKQERVGGDDGKEGGREGGREGEEERPASLATTATGEELINMDHFNSTSSVVSSSGPSLRGLRGREGGLEGGREGSGASVGLGSGPTSLDDRCIEAILQLGASSGDHTPYPPTTAPALAQGESVPLGGEGTLLQTSVRGGDGGGKGGMGGEGRGWRIWR